MNCDWIDPNAGILICATCRRPLIVTWKAQVTGVARQCKAKIAAGVPRTWPTSGVGRELTKLLAEANFFDAPGCQCKSAAAQMDARGIAYCQEQTGWIRTVLKAEHDRQKLDVWDEDIVRGFLIPEAIRRAKDDPNAKP
jgi:hypothetical protein